MAHRDPVARIERLVQRAERAIRARFMSLIDALRGSLKLDDLADLISRGRVDEAMALLDRAAFGLGATWAEHFALSGAAVAVVIRRALRSVVVDFDRTNDRAVRRVRESRARMARELSRQQREAATDALVEGVRRGANPRQTARAFRDSVGLIRHQWRAVQNYRRALEDLDRDALRRVLRDRRFDPSVDAAMRSGSPLAASRIDRMVERYRQRMIAHRAETIARTEALRAVHEGSDEMFRQAIDAGDLDPARLVQEWVTARDERVRGSHRVMHRQQRPMGEPFTSGLGSRLRYPGDPEAPASETVQCRCVRSVRILAGDELQRVAGLAITGVGG